MEPWYKVTLPRPEVREGRSFNPDEFAIVYLLTKAKAKTLKAKPEAQSAVTGTQANGATERPISPPLSTTAEDQPPRPESVDAVSADSGKKTVRITGSIPPEVWNRLGTKLLPKLRAGSELRVGLELIVGFDATTAAALQLELKQIFGDLNLTEQLRVEVK